jgi:DNA-binding MarR family transcriptional regulator
MMSSRIAFVEPSFAKAACNDNRCHGLGAMLASQGPGGHRGRNSAKERRDCSGRRLGKAMVNVVARMQRPVEADAAIDPMKVWFRFLRLHNRVSVAMSARLRAIGLSIPQFDLLSTLTEREGITQSELAERLYVTKGNVSGLVDRLVDAGLVERRAIATDRRSYALHLTENGRKLAERGLETQQAYVKATLGGLPDEDLAVMERLLLSWREKARAAAK